MSDGVRIGNNVSIHAEKVEIGLNSIIENNTTIRSLGNIMDNCKLGDNCLIGFFNQILVPEFTMLDYSKLHNSGLCSGYKPLKIGYNCWIGQHAILNSYEELTIGNNVRMGGCQIWTHVASGELLEGCKFFDSSPVVIEDNVWLMGFGQMVTPGTILRRNSIIMSGSVVTKSTEPYHIYSGIPAIDITNKLNGWKQMSLNDKFNLLSDFIDEFFNQHPEYKERIFLLKNEADIDSMKDIFIKAPTKLIFVKRVKNFQKIDDKFNTFFDLNTKRYIKRSSKIEIDWMKFCVGYRARFIPLNLP
jgi:acetyltransferase-like isoleucine patch superfamily enzyme